MKKIIAVLLSIFILGIFVSCDKDILPPPADEFKPEKAVIKIGESYTDFEGMEIQITDFVWDDEKIKIEVAWINNTPYEVLYGEPFDIQREKDGEWSSCLTLDNFAFNMIGYMLPSGTSQTKAYVLTDVFDIYENGKYRFKTDCSIYEKGQNAERTECNLWVEFTVSRVGDTSGDVKKNFVDFGVQYVRTNGYHEDVEYPVVKIIRSVEELNEYYENTKDKYDLGRKENVYADTTIGFLDACDKYDEAYFEEQILVMVLLEEGSGSIRHNVDNVKLGTDGKLYVSIRTISPEVGTADMAEWHILIEPEENVDVKSEDDVVVLINGTNPKTQPSVVREGGIYSNIALTVPYDWEYQTVRGEDSIDYCIEFWPEGQTSGKIQVWYYDAFGVCGTGLEEEKITIAGYEANKGTYDNKDLWDFISLIGMPGKYVIMNLGAEVWWGEYGVEAMEILESMRVAEGIINRAEAIAIAEKNVTVKYDQTHADFDTEKGLWNVSFSQQLAAGGNQDFVITHEGKIVDVIFGE